MTGDRTVPTALLCDADGNLFPSEEPAFVASAVVTNSFLAAMGVREAFSPEQLRLSTTGKNFRTTAVDLAVAHGVPVERELVGARPGSVVTEQPVLTRRLLQQWVDEERERVSAHLGQVLAPDPEVLEPLRRMSRHCELAAVSSSATPRLRACFQATGIDTLIPADRLFSAEDSLPEPTSKPHPAVYLHACRVLGVEPAAAVAVEDSVPGVQSAVAAGIPTLGNLQFVAEDERAERERLLLAAGAEAVLLSWTEVERHVIGAAS